MDDGARGVGSNEEVEMHQRRAFVAGIVGAAVMTLFVLWFNAAGIPLPIDTRLAALLGTRLWVVGLAAHLLVGGVLGLFYAFIFEHVVHQSGLGVGMMLGAYNTIFAGFIWALLGGPGAFWDRAGAPGIFALFVSHVAYGAVVGALYPREPFRIYG
jgi:hypothetical protein